MSKYSSLCPSHPTLNITNLCTVCREPICPECLENHDYQHKANSIGTKYVSISKAKSVCSTKIDYLITQFKDEKVKLSRLSEYGKHTILERNLTKLEESKKKVQTIIDGFFRQKEREITTAIDSFHVSNPAEIEKAERKVNESLSHLERLQVKLEGENSVKTVLKIIEDQTLEGNYSQVSTEVNQKLKIFQSNLSHIEENEKELMNLNQTLNRYCYVAKGPLNTQKSLRIEVPNENNNLLSSSGEGKVLYKERKPIFTDQKTTKKENHAISFGNSNLLPTPKSTNHLWFGYFRDGTNHFSFMDLERSQKSGLNSLTTVELNINFKIPLNHKSVVCESGEILLIGGQEIEQGNTLSSKAFILSQKNLKLQELSPMNSARAFFGCCTHGNNVYVGGGVAKGGKKFESFSLSQNKWNVLPDYFTDSNGFSLCSSQNAIYKFGGKLDEFTYSDVIEVFSLSEGSWRKFKILQEGLPVKLPTFCGGFCSSQGIIIMGGYFHSKPSLEEYTVRVSNESEGNAELIQRTKSNIKGEITSEFIILNGKALAFTRELPSTQGNFSFAQPEPKSQTLITKQLTF